MTDAAAEALAAAQDALADGEPEMAWDKVQRASVLLERAVAAEEVPADE